MLGLVSLLVVPVVLHCIAHLGPFLPGRGFGRPYDAKICSQADILYPYRNAIVLENISVRTCSLREQSNGSDAHTESYDNLDPIGVDERWEAFRPFHDYLSIVSPHGAGSLSQVLLKKYGEGSFALLVDEGSGFSEIGGTVIAVPGIAEKGICRCYGDGLYCRRVLAFSPASSSSSIKPQLDRDTLIYRTVQCVRRHAKEFPAHLRAFIKTSVHSDRALRKLETELIKDPAYKSLIGTTQAIDLIQGGVKSNALPEEAWAVVNHRIATQSSVSVVQQRDTDLPKQLAKEFNLTFTAFGSDITPKGASTAGKFTLTDAWGTSLEPASVTPTEDSAPWRLLSGTIKAAYNAHGGLEDTRYYWKLTPHIVRYSHQGGVDISTMHSVNEHIGANDFVEMIRFFTTLILNVDEATTL
ncbi:hypothetical protein EDB89DRAFT_1910059 [Lactarius sanguifluus]|nr:hypothetical protein EDB89DRAFT_1910059 [Lactarius sanguifluus]